MKSFTSYNSTPLSPSPHSHSSSDTFPWGRHFHLHSPERTGSPSGDSLTAPLVQVLNSCLEESADFLSPTDSSSTRGPQLSFCHQPDSSPLTCFLPPHAHSESLSAKCGPQGHRKPCLPQCTEQKTQSLFLLGSRPRGCCLHALAPPHSLGFRHLHHAYLKLLDTHDLPLFHLQALGTPRMLVCHAFFLHPA